MRVARSALLGEHFLHPAPCFFSQLPLARRYTQRRRALRASSLWCSATNSTFSHSICSHPRPTYHLALSVSTAAPAARRPGALDLGETLPAVDKQPAPTRSNARDCRSHPPHCILESLSCRSSPRRRRFNCQAANRLSGFSRPSTLDPRPSALNPRRCSTAQRSTASIQRQAARVAARADLTRPSSIDGIATVICRLSTHPRHPHTITPPRRAFTRTHSFPPSERANFFHTSRPSHPNDRLCGALRKRWNRCAQSHLSVSCVSSSSSKQNGPQTCPSLLCFSFLSAAPEIKHCNVSFAVAGAASA
ncbi:hypothetical protein B0H67DRAFT_110765 [Lasiosphaeris hirsuta]|uniref:Uncharacterized protein n=1 Tax=Lasiosphaeris hirsuta TaxID=260670 RepID=A0AA40AZ80_9PEZI|nr:hypothetical protein B0H67DRAFT_110765 [Lasiosphaeris hirsuta]